MGSAKTWHTKRHYKEIKVRRGPGVLREPDPMDNVACSKTVFGGDRGKG
jgi:hypothetical protein